MNKTIFGCAVALCALLLWSCGEAPYSGAGESERFGDAAPSESEKTVDSEKPVDGDLSRALGNTDGSGGQNAQNQRGVKDQVAERKRIYTADNEIEVADVENTKDKIREYVVGAGGIVDTISDNYLSVRVPYQKFDEAVKWTLTLGKVLKNDIENYDVSDYYSDVDARLKLALQTRTRLNQLLENTSDVEARVEILREIRRLSEQIESLQQTLRIIDDAVAYSRIDISLRQTSAADKERSEAVFPWIAALNPAGQSITSGQEVLDVDLGPNFARFGNGRPFYAESPQGIKVKIGSVRNNPKGDTAFWAKALRHYMAPRYAKVEDLQFGSDLKGLRLTSFDVVPYVYEVLVQTRGDNVVVCEVYFPTLEHFSASGTEVEAAFAKTAQRSGS